MKPSLGVGAVCGGFEKCHDIVDIAVTNMLDGRLRPKRYDRGILEPGQGALFAAGDADDVARESTGY